MKICFMYFSIIFVGCLNQGCGKSPVSSVSISETILLNEVVVVYPDRSYVVKPFEPWDIDNDGILNAPQDSRSFNQAILLPQIKKVTPPIFPEIAAKAGLKSSGLYKFLISADGKVSSIQVLRVQEIFRQTGIDTILKSVFTPAEVESGRISVWVILQINFSSKTGPSTGGILG